MEKNVSEGEEIVAIQPINVLWSQPVVIDYDLSPEETIRLKSSLRVVDLKRYSNINEDLLKIKSSEQGVQKVDLLLVDVGGLISQEIAEQRLFLFDPEIRLAGINELCCFLEFFQKGVFDRESYQIVAGREYYDVGRLYKMLPSLYGHPRHLVFGGLFKSLLPYENVLFLCSKKADLVNPKSN